MASCETKELQREDVLQLLPPSSQRALLPNHSTTYLLWDQLLEKSHDNVDAILVHGQARAAIGHLSAGEFVLSYTQQHNTDEKSIGVYFILGVYMDFTWDLLSLFGVYWGLLGVCLGFICGLREQLKFNPTTPTLCNSSLNRLFCEKNGSHLQGAFVKGDTELTHALCQLLLCNVALGSQALDAAEDEGHLAIQEPVRVRLPLVA